jgi:molybdopterin molybdotransferase
MEIEIQLTEAPIPERVFPLLPTGAVGAWLEFRGIIRAEENGKEISALEYEAYPEMAEREIRRILESLAHRHPCLAVKVIHRIGAIPVGETAIYVGVASPHRGEALLLVMEFMNQLKQDVPIWKARSLAAVQLGGKAAERSSSKSERNSKGKPLSFDEAQAEIQSHVQPLQSVHTPLGESLGRILREDVKASEDFPSYDRSTRDGYAILQNDTSETFQIVDTLHAADWKPRQLKVGEAIRVATGTALPCENLRVVMQEDVERTGDKIKITHQERGTNVRKRGEEMHAGEIALPAGTCLNAAALAMLATVGYVQPLVNSLLRAVHFTTGDEVVPPEQKPKSGQIRDSNSILIRSLLQKFPGDLVQSHLPENFEGAMSRIENYRLQIEHADLLLISGGASVGEKDFTRDLLAHLGFEIIFSRLKVRPGAPLIFGMKNRRVAFGLPGNPVSHLVCFHLFVAAALGKLTGAGPQRFFRGALASSLDDGPSPRETFLPARARLAGLHPLKWMSSGDITCLAQTNALIRIPANCGPLGAGAEVEFLPV